MNFDQQLENIIKEALREDIGTGDITTAAVIPDDSAGRGSFLFKEKGIAAGFEVVQKVFSVYDPSLKFTKYFSEGDEINFNTVAAVVEGKTSSILTTERTALNFFQRMSGIATAVHNCTEKIKHTRAEIIDTRKTVPGLRIIDKLAVKSGGGQNHRMGLYDMFLIKDNHIEAAGSLLKAVNLCKEYRDRNKLYFKIEVEASDSDQVKEALSSGADIILLDNFSPENLKKAVELIAGKVKTEASGMININNVKEVAETGVDFISMGTLTHSVKALDISLEIQKSK
jgi:nicotinate-nucleotide pyrophosphorylase (carboxylating)